LILLKTIAAAAAAAASSSSSSSGLFISFAFADPPDLCKCGLFTGES
jgi:hypothetical protein